MYSNNTALSNWNLLRVELKYFHTQNIKWGKGQIYEAIDALMNSMGDNLS